MGDLKLTSASGSVTLSPENVAGTTTITVPSSTATLATNENFTSTGIDDNATSTAITIDSSGNVATPGITLGNGTTYNAANHLDDYEEGTVSNPLYVGGTQQTTYRSGGGYDVLAYTKVGSLVTCTTNIDTYLITLVGTGSVKLDLPFTAASSGHCGNAGYSFYQSSIAWLEIGQSITQLTINGDSIASTNDRIRVQFTFTYRTDS